MTEEADGPDVSLDQLATELRELEERADRARDGLKEAEGQAKQIDRQLEEVGERLEGAAGPRRPGGGDHHCQGVGRIQGGRARRW